eukprot:gb/GECH01005097.1/.p1 GENE.gb/GECH01005097.1/~~gb/GECH01005097.1/.p1  ORF type:complete len:306 (+),score=52.31 gb/GECH01005097.1/:1-918(+)
MIHHIENELFLGDQDAATQLNEHNITHTLCVCGDPRSLSDERNSDAHATTPSGDRHVTVGMDDRPQHNLLEHLPRCLEFMGYCHRYNHALLVYCESGVSRSVAVVAAYLMQHHHISAAEALQRISRIHPQASPNPGFRIQLRAFRSMGYQVDRASSVYASAIAASAATHAGTILYGGDNSCRSDNADNDGAGNITTTENRTKGVACRRCRTQLGTTDDAVTHEPGEGAKRFFNKRKKEGGIGECKSVFFGEPLPWMKEMTEIQGKLECPKCNHRIGHWNWSGMQCSCGVWVTPAIAMPKSKVDIL